MSYIGQNPVFGDFPYQTLTGDGTSSYTLNFNISNENGILVFLNGAVQRPGVDYTAGGTSLQFADNVTLGTQIFVYGMGLPKSMLSTSLGSIDYNMFSATTQDSLIKVVDFNNIPTSDIGPIYVKEMNSFWEWVVTPYFTGYRSLNSGKLDFGWTPTPLPWQVEAIGGVLNEVDHGGLISRFRESGLETPIGSWVAGEYKIASLGGGDWRAPDMRNQFLRFTGTDADTANARLVGTYQADALQNITGSLLSINLPASAPTGAFTLGTPAGTSYQGGAGAVNSFNFNASNVARTALETRGMNAAFLPVINL